MTRQSQHINYSPTAATMPLDSDMHVKTVHVLMTHTTTKMAWWHNVRAINQSINQSIEVALVAELLQG